MKFSDVIGQEAIKNRLIQGFNAGRIAHAQIFSGLEGTGGLPLALAYAQFIACTNKSETDSCGECANCRKHRQMIHPDVNYVFPYTGSKEMAVDFYPQWRKNVSENPYITYNAWIKTIGTENSQGNIPIRECQNILKTLSLKPFEGGYKTLILWLPEFLGNEGNVLLKIIEEPPHQTLFLLITENIDKVLGTILSRTQLIRVPPIDEINMQQWFEKQELETGIAKQLAKLSEGNLVTAKELLEHTDNEFFEPFKTYMNFCAQNKLSACQQWAAEFSRAGRESTKSFLRYGLELIRGALMVKNGHNELSHNEDEINFINKLAGLLKNEKSVEFLQQNFSEAIYYIERNGNMGLILTDLCFKVFKVLKKN